MTDRSGEPGPHRDVGPYLSAEQARAQLSASMYGIPADHAAPGFAAETVLMEALHRAGVEISGWEDVHRQEIARALTPEAAQVIAGWIGRAHTAGAGITTEQLHAALTDHQPVEPDPRRDSGPYLSAKQVHAQLLAVMSDVRCTRPMPAGPAEMVERLAGVVGELVLVGALSRAGHEFSRWEDGQQRQEIRRVLTPTSAQVIAGWIERAHLAGAGITTP